MSINLNIPVYQSITLPDDWQKCQTPQELNYWLVAQLQTTNLKLAEAMSDIETLQNKVATIMDTVKTYYNHHIELIFTDESGENSYQIYFDFIDSHGGPYDDQYQILKGKSVTANGSAFTGSHYPITSIEFGTGNDFTMMIYNPETGEPASDVQGYTSIANGTMTDTFTLIS